MKENWYLVGDVHGDADPIKAFYLANRDRLKLDTSKNYMIILGDAGLNFALQGGRDRRAKNEFAKLPFTFICLRGNHEARVQQVVSMEPDRWETQEKYGGAIYVERDFPSIEYLLDSPAIYNFGDYKALSIPGAYSVDKWFRLRNNWPWFEDELLSETEMAMCDELIKNEKKFDLIISHTCPSRYEPTDLFLSGIDQSSVDKSMEIWMNGLQFDNAYKRWAWGHFHADRLYPAEGEKQCMMLGCGSVVDLDKFMHMGARDSFDDIRA